MTRAERPETGLAAMTALLIGVVLAPLNTTMIAVALLPIGTDLGVDPGAVMWLIVSFYLTSVVAQPLAGSFVDRLGPKAVYVCGLAVVALAGLLPLLFREFIFVILARLLLGFGFAVAYPAALAYARQQANRLGRTVAPTTLAAISTAGLATAAVGPLVGGILVVTFDWTATFWVNTPVAVVGLVMSAVFLRGNRQADRLPGAAGSSASGSLDVVGLILFAVAMVGLTTVLLGADVPAVSFLAVSAVAGSVFVLWEWRARRPFIDVRLLVTNGPLTRTYLRQLLTYLGPYTATFAVSQWLQSDAGMGALDAGMVLLPMAVMAAIVTVVVSRSRRVMVSLIVASACGVLGGVALAMTTSTTPLWGIVLCMVVFGVTHGLGAVSNQLALYRFAPAEMLGVAAGLSRSAVSMSAVVTSSLIALAFPTVPSESGMQLLGLIVSGAALVVMLLIVFDRSLRREEEP